MVHALLRGAEVDVTGLEELYPVTRSIQPPPMFSVGCFLLNVPAHDVSSETTSSSIQAGNDSDPAKCCCRADQQVLLLLSPLLHF